MPIVPKVLAKGPDAKNLRKKRVLVLFSSTASPAMPMKSLSREMLRRSVMSSLNLRCPNPKCRVTLAVPLRMQGTQVRCAGCGQSFLVPPSGLAVSRPGQSRNTQSRVKRRFHNAA